MVIYTVYRFYVRKLFGAVKLAKNVDLDKYSYSFLLLFIFCYLVGLVKQDLSVLIDNKKNIFRFFVKAQRIVYMIIG